MTIRFERQGLLGRITIDRPKALNAMNTDMAAAMLDQLRAWADDRDVECVMVEGTGKAFCAGGDIRAVYEMGREAMRFFKPEYDLCRLIRAYPKPYVALMDGITFGGGVGISIYASHRIATPNTLWAMPECAIGFYPDIGATWFLPRLPGEVGTYLALTGARLQAGDLMALGIATGFTEDGEKIIEGLKVGILPPPTGRGQGEGTKASDKVPSPALAGTLSPRERDVIARCFSFDTAEEIIAAVTAESSPWSETTLTALKRASPTSLKVTLRQMRLGRELGFDQAIDLEFELTRRFLERPDFFEGVRALLVDRDQAPCWQPEQLADVDPAMVENFFTGP